MSHSFDGADITCLGFLAQERKPELTSEVMAFRDYLLSSTVSDTLDVWELKGNYHRCLSADSCYLCCVFSFPSFNIVAPSPLKIRNIMYYVMRSVCFFCYRFRAPNCPKDYPSL